MIRVIRSRRPGLYIRRRIIYRRRWVKWVGLAALPIGEYPRRWVGLALEIPTRKPKPSPRAYRRHDRDGHRYRISYDPINGKALDDYNKPDNKEGG